MNVLLCLTNTIKKKVDLIMEEDQNNDFNENLPYFVDKDQYGMLLDNVLKSIIHVKSFKSKLVIYLTALLFPADQYSYGFDNSRAILASADLTYLIDDVIEMLQFTFSCFENINDSSTEKNKYVVYDCIIINKIYPVYLYKLSKNMTLYDVRTPLVRDVSTLERICSKNKNYFTFMDYLYHVALFVKDNTKSNNIYIRDISNNYHNKIIKIIILFGENEKLTEKDLKDWFLK